MSAQIASGLLEVVVSKRREVSQDVCELELATEAGGLPTFTAGSHIDVVLPSGTRRSYTLCRLPGKLGTYSIAVLRDCKSRGGSEEIHRVCHPGAGLKISRPKNNFELSSKAGNHIFVAGGIGITPMLAMVQHLGADSQWQLHYFVREKSRAAFADELTHEYGAQHVKIHVNGPGVRDFKELQRLLAQEVETETHLYVCGPTGMIDHVTNLAVEAGWPQARMHKELFAGAETTVGTNKPFSVRLRSSGRVIQVEQGDSIAQALTKAGMSPMLSCEQGVCGTCLTGVVTGEPDHRDSYLSSDERSKNDQILICCSRSFSEELVLDL